MVDGATSITNCNIGVSVIGANTAGGFVGLYNGGKIQNSSAVGTVMMTGTASGAIAGGFVGSMNGTAIINTSAGYAAVNTENGAAQQHIGGFVGKMDGGTISTATAQGNLGGVNLADATNGGFAGTIGSGITKIENTYTLGTAGTAGLKAGSFVGKNSADAGKFQNCIVSSEKGIFGTASPVSSVAEVHPFMTIPASIATDKFDEYLPISAQNGAYDMQFASWEILSGSTGISIINPASISTNAVLAVGTTAEQQIRAKYTNNAGTAMYSPILKITPKAAGTQILVPDWATFEKIGNDPFFPLDASYLQTADIIAPVGTVYQTKGTLSGGYDGGGFGIDLAGIGKNDWKAKGDDCGLFGIISGSVKNMRLKNATADFGVLNSGILAGTVTGTVNDVAGTNFTITANLPTAGAMSYASGLIGVGKGAVLSNLSIDTLKMDIQGGGNLGGCYTTGLASLIDGSKISGTNRISNANIVLTGNQLVNGQAYGVAILINNTTASGLYIDNSTVMMKGSVDDAYMGGITGVHANSTFTNGEARNVNVISETTGNNMNMGGALSFNHVGSRTENVNVIGGQVVNRCTNIARTYMGGFAAEIYQGGVIKNCSTSADVLNVNTAGLIGGFIGRCSADANSFVKIEGCTASGKISATKNGSIGGFAGEISNSPMYFKNNVTTSKITTQAKNKELYLGGFVGNMGLTGANLVTTTPSAPTDTFYN
ncbi:MAG: hypothetical protein RR826_06105, partial [Christensenellaceae bacterium]